ncbi:MAG TPA: protein-disulfide reductase DsbD domain-containing protein, partial [Nevskiaceae bacterium]|nr:protein-disulfide reductase DsbD domain-containing protein [Nevskiaceae bacterium]
MTTSKYSLLLACALLNPAWAQAAAVQADHIEAELIAERTALQPGADNWVALRLKPETGWHVYWQNPGDTGLATKLAWTLPDGITAGAIEWPYPQLQQQRDLTNYGYDHETLHLVPVTVAENFGAKTATLKAQAKWLVCSDVCIPGKADLALDLPVGGEAKPDPRWMEKFAQARTQLPQAPPGWEQQFSTDHGDLTLRLSGADAAFSRASKIEFFPVANDAVNHHAPQRIALDNDHTLRLTQQQSTYYVPHSTLRGVLVLHGAGDNGTRAYAIDAQPGAVLPVSADGAVKKAADPG